MKYLLMVVISIFSLHAIAQNDIEVEAAKVEKRALSGSFSAISVANGIDVFLTQTDEASIAVSAADEKYLEHFITTVFNGTLKIYYDTKALKMIGVGKRKLKAYVSCKMINKLAISSGSQVVLKTVLKLAELDCSVSSGSSFSGEVNIGALTVAQSSGSDVELSGTATKLQVEVNSGAIFKGYELSVDYCQAKATSGGGVRITVNKELNAKANSGGGVRYKGEAVIKDLSVSSGGLVKKA